MSDYEYRSKRSSDPTWGSPVDVVSTLGAVISALAPSTAFDVQVRGKDQFGNWLEWSPTVSGTTGNPFKLDAVKIMWAGNSLTLGAPDHAPYDPVTLLAAQMATDGIVGVDALNLGHDGAETNALRSYATTEMYPFVDAARWCIAPFEEIGNDIYNNGDVASAVSNYQAWRAEIVAQGITPLIIIPAHRGTVSSANTPFGDTEAQFQTKMASARSLVKAWAIANNYAYVELMADSRLADCTNATYYVDRVHHTHLGYQIKKGLVYAALQALAASYTDTLAPVIQSITVEDAHPNQVVVTLREHLNEAGTGTFTPSGKTVLGYTVSGNEIRITVNSNYVYTDTITLTYSSGNFADLAGNLLATFSGSSVTNNLTPVEVPLTFGTFTNMSQTGTTVTAINTVSGWNHYGEATQHLPASTDGYLKWTNPAGNGSMLGFNTTNESAGFANYEYAIFQNSAVFYYITNGSPTGTAVGFANGDKSKLDRTAGVISGYRIRSGISTLIHTWGGTNNSAFYINADIQSDPDTITDPVGVNVI